MCISHFGQKGCQHKVFPFQSEGSFAFSMSILTKISWMWEEGGEGLPFLKILLATRLKYITSEDCC